MVVVGCHGSGYSVGPQHTVHLISTNLTNRTHCYTNLLTSIRERINRCTNVFTVVYVCVSPVCTYICAVCVMCVCV